MKTYSGQILAALLVLTVVLSGQEAGAQTISGIGARDCRAFSAALEIESDQALDSYVAWTQGYISARNASKRGADVRLDPSSIIVWLGQFCAANPTARVFDGVTTLLEQSAR